MQKKDITILTKKLTKIFGLNSEQTRIDESIHPFCGGNPYDNRITSFNSEDNFLQSVLAVIHESGHALYEQNLPLELINQPVGRARGMAMHESQSLFMEKQIGSSLEFISWLTKYINNISPKYNFSPEHLYSVINNVEPSLIRISADELTYPLHIAIRYLIEKKLVNKQISIADLPDIWDSMYEKYLGIRPSKQGDGCLQDIHWYSGAFGYFPSYTAGAIIASMLGEKLQTVFQDFSKKLNEAVLGDITHWLQVNIHSKASTLPLDKLLNNAAGRGLDYKCYLNYLSNKFC